MSATTARPPANSYDSRQGEVRWERLGDPDVVGRTRQSLHRPGRSLGSHAPGRRRTRLRRRGRTRRARGPRPRVPELGAGRRRVAAAEGREFFAQLGPHTDALRHLPAQAHRLLLREYVTTASSPGLRPSVLDALTAPWLGDAGQAAFFRQLAQRRDDPSSTSSTARATCSPRTAPPSSPPPCSRSSSLSAYGRYSDQNRPILRP